MTNEQRAHDIAVALIPIVMEEAKNKIRSNADEYQKHTEIRIDAFQVYMDSYVMALNALNKEFPDGK